MANKKECDRCKTLGDSGSLRDWGTVEVKNIDGNRESTHRQKDLCPKCKVAVIQFIGDVPQVPA